MNFNKTGKIFMMLAIVAVLGIAVTSFAGWGRGNSGYGMMGQGYGMMGQGNNMMGQGYGMQPGGNNGSGYYGNQGNEEMARFNKEHEAFYEETSQLRGQLYQKQLELRSELAKPEPDAKKAAGLQKEISNLEGQLDQKHLEQRIKMRKDFPRSGYMGQGYGPRGKGMGRGMYGGGGYGRGGGGCRY